MKAFDPLIELIASFSLKKMVSLVTVLAILLGTAWFVDSHMGYSQLCQLERSVSILERLDNLDRKGGLSKDVSEARTALVNELNEKTRQRVENFRSQAETGLWQEYSWLMLVLGALPWFLVSLFTVPVFNKSVSSGWLGFGAFQILTLLFGLINAVIPPMGSFWINGFLLPWALMLAFVGIPASVSAFRKVRDDSLRKTVKNNLRQLASAFGMYCLEKSKTEATYYDLIRDNRYLRPLIPVAGEHYETITFKAEQPISVVLGNGEVVTSP